MNRLPVSAFIIARNEADRIPRAIRSVRDWVDELLVIDSGSEDDTVAVAEELGARVIHHDWRGYGPQKIFGESLCSNDWLLNIDADEEVSPALHKEIAALFAGGKPACNAYRVPVQPVYPLRKKGHPWTISNFPVRLYRKSCAGFRDHPVHDAVIVRRGATGRLSRPLLHRSFRSLRHHVEKVNDYSDAQAGALVNEGRRPSLLALLLLPPLAFLKSYLLRREFVNGIDGIVISHMYAFQRFIRLAKARERLRKQETKTNDS